MEEEERTLNPFVSVRGKCTYWREQLNDEERWDTRIKSADRTVDCTCFVEGDVWTVTVGTMPSDCPNRDHCRYYVKTT